MKPLELRGYSLVDGRLQPALPELDDMTQAERLSIDSINLTLAVDQEVAELTAALAAAKERQRQARRSVPGNWDTLYKRARKIMLAEVQHALIKSQKSGGTLSL